LIALAVSELVEFDQERELGVAALLNGHVAGLRSARHLPAQKSRRLPAAGAPRPLSLVGHVFGIELGHIAPVGHVSRVELWPIHAVGPLSPASTMSSL